VEFDVLFWARLLVCSSLYDSRFQSVLFEQFSLRFHFEFLIFVRSFERIVSKFAIVGLSLDILFSR